MHIILHNFFLVFHLPIFPGKQISAIQYRSFSIYPSFLSLKDAF